MNPLLMILASLAGVAVMACVFTLQQGLRRRRVARRRVLYPVCEHTETEVMESAVTPRQ